MSEIREMSSTEFLLWQVYYLRKIEREKKAAEQAKKKKPGRR